MNKTDYFLQSQYKPKTVNTKDPNIHRKCYICELAHKSSNSILMKRIIFLFILVLSLSNMAFCQSCKDEFFILEGYTLVKKDLQFSAIFKKAPFNRHFWLKAHLNAKRE